MDKLSSLPTFNTSHCSSGVYEAGRWGLGGTVEVGDTASEGQDVKVYRLGFAMGTLARGWGELRIGSDKGLAEVRKVTECTSN